MLTVSETSSPLPHKYRLVGNYPNPFNPSTTIVYELPERGHVRMSVYDIMGGEVHVLVDATRGAGIHELRVEAKLLPTGVYFYRMETPVGTFVGRMTLAK